MTWDSARLPPRTAAPGRGAGRPEVPGQDAGRAGVGRSVGQARHRAVRERGDRWLLGADCAAGLTGAFAVRPGTGPLLLATLLGGLLLAYRQAGLYRPRFAPAAFDELPALAVGTALTWGCVAVALGAMVPRRALEWGELLIAVVVTVLTADALRALLYAVRRRLARRHPGSTLIVGNDLSVRQIAAALSAHPEYGMRPVGIAVPAPGGLPDSSEPPPVPVLSAHGDIRRAVIQNAVRYAVVTGPADLDPRTRSTVRLLASQGATVWQVTPGPGPTPGGGPTGSGHLWGFACRRFDPFAVPGKGRWGKRALDAALSGLALLCLAPVLAACALAVRLTDGPGVIFRQERIGLGGRTFTLLKFRTMRPADAHESATRWNIADDQRMGRVGRLMRRASLDELPQLWNVLRGDMSMVGPRPERPYFVEQFSQAHPGYQDRHRMPVGITGLAQIHGLRGDTSIADRARFDNHYIDTWSLWQDVSILLRTATSLFKLGGS
ncbi:sugar transferase [Streptomyces sp. NPDC051976]|uniref:sugar transferase n=1 Tax=Streptomyces sp. NPDC051976 TaxID=3154947 RepID=UPI0034378AE9